MRAQLKTNRNNETNLTETWESHSNRKFLKSISVGFPASKAALSLSWLRLNSVLFLSSSFSFSNFSCSSFLFSPFLLFHVSLWLLSPRPPSSLLLQPYLICSRHKMQTKRPKCMCELLPCTEITASAVSMQENLQIPLFSKSGRCWYPVFALRSQHSPCQFKKIHQLSDLEIRKILEPCQCEQIHQLSDLEIKQQFGWQIFALRSKYLPVSVWENSSIKRFRDRAKEEKQTDLQASSFQDICQNLVVLGTVHLRFLMCLAKNIHFSQRLHGRGGAQAGAFVFGPLAHQSPNLSPSQAPTWTTKGCEHCSWTRAWRSRRSRWWGNLPSLFSFPLCSHVLVSQYRVLNADQARKLALEAAKQSYTDRTKNVPPASFTISERTVRNVLRKPNYHGEGHPSLVPVSVHYTTEHRVAEQKISRNMLALAFALQKTSEYVTNDGQISQDTTILNHPGTWSVRRGLVSSKKRKLYRSMNRNFISVNAEHPDTVLHTQPFKSKLFCGMMASGRCLPFLLCLEAPGMPVNEFPTYDEQKEADKKHDS